MYTKTDIEMLAEDFESCRKVLVALGDENRQYLILEMMKMENWAHNIMLCDYKFL